ncbi:unnamed protein product, partial [Mesorhabditis belari]|uniref:Phosphoinositide phospholipase C n=1 Tax=Mesorhabditis belari TaxID=2138241 RepID=A0AAF3FLR8_9BILA
MPPEINGTNGHHQTPAQAETERVEDEKARALEDIKSCEKGFSLKRIKHGSLRESNHVSIRERRLNYHSRYHFSFLPDRLKSVEISEILEVRPGYRTDNLHKAARKSQFQEAAPEETCFSVIFTHSKFLHKSVDFSAQSREIRDIWVNALTFLINAEKAQRAQFNEKLWLIEQFHRADVNKNGMLTFGETWELLKKLNLQLSEKYAKAVFNESDVLKKDGRLNEEEFLKFFNMLTERPDLAFVLRSYSESGVESWTAKELHRFLTEEQQFTDVNESKAASILETFEGVQQNGTHEKLMGIVGIRRLFQSRWGDILRPDHESVFQNMDHPLPHYFCNSSHNTYLIASQLKGEASIEGYILALRKGARLLELDVFSGDQGEPIITHKNTLITPLSLRHALRSIQRTAFETSPYPVILTIENHCGHAQQKVMAELFLEILGDQLYRPPPDADKHPLPSPNQLKRKFIIRGKRGVFAHHEEEDDDDKMNKHSRNMHQKKTVSSVVDETLSSLMALPSVKLSATSMYADCKNHPQNGSPSLVESKAFSLYDSGAPLAAYTADHFVKVFPKGLRQDSSNVHPVSLWNIGIQGVALNFQTSGEPVDLNVGKFRTNGNCGYVLKPQELIDGKDLRTLARPKMRIGIGIISAQYLPKPDTGKDIIDPYVSIQVFGVPRDEWKVKTKTIKDNGFNPVWNESFEHELVCPEMALIRFVVKDFDATSSNDFVGEFSLPVQSLRPGYSSMRLHTGYAHTLDTSATLFVRISVENL